MNPEIAQKSPYILELAAGTYYWCACGKSAKQPFCDGSHRGTGLAPIAFALVDSQKVALCGCKHSANGHLCDGSHRKL